jgi:cobalt/nickel transport system permease protein
MHLADGILPAPLLIGGTVAAIGLLAVGLRKTPADAIPVAGVTAAALFVGSAVHIPIGPASAHLLLSGMAGALLGWAAVPVILVVLILQWMILGMGGVSTLGINFIIQAAAALTAFAVLRTGSQSTEESPSAWRLFAAGALSVLVAGILLTAALALAGRPFFRIAALALAASLPLAPIEGMVCMAAFRARQRFLGEQTTHPASRLP